MRDASASAPPSGILTGLLPSERLLFAGNLVCLGLFRASPHDPGFSGGHPCTGHTIVFPRRAIWIRHEGQRARVFDPTVVPLYNRGQVYERRAIDPRGDECEWMAFSPAVLIDALRALGHPAQDRPEAPFDVTAAQGSGELYAAARRLFAAASASPQGRDEIEERALRVLDLVLRRYVRQPREPRPPLEAIEEAKRLLNLEGPAPVSLSALASQCGLSPYRLCREFRRATGSTISAYRGRLRLRRALGPLPRATDLAALAFASGFSSHSHFAAAFRREFHVTPSRLRAELAGRCN